MGAADDVWMWVQGSLTNGSSFNYGEEDYSQGYQYFATSPLDGGLTVSEVQVNMTNPSNNGEPWNFLESFVEATAYSSLSLSIPAPYSSKSVPVLSVTDGGTTKKISLNKTVTLTHGEQISWNGTTVVETVNDPSTGGKIVTTGIFESSSAESNNVGYINLEVQAYNTVLGGWLFNTAWNASNIGSSCTPPPVGTFPPSPTPIPSPTSSPCAVTTGTPNPHPTQNVNAPLCGGS